ncbi:MAG: DUF1587 domain-containing protein, partial [Verrucomicrobiaceae bacterium]
MRLVSLFLLVLLPCLPVAGAEAPSVSPDAVGFTKVAQPFLKEHCIRCHGPEKQKGELRLDTLANNFADPLVKEKWAEVINTVNSHEMPPEEEPQPKPEEAGPFADWISGELARAEIAKRSTSIVLRRLNRAEYNNTIRDLIGVNFLPAEKFPEDPPASGFDNIGRALTVSPLHL